MNASSTEGLQGAFTQAQKEVKMDKEILVKTYRLASQHLSEAQDLSNIDCCIPGNGHTIYLLAHSPDKALAVVHEYQTSNVLGDGGSKIVLDAIGIPFSKKGQYTGEKLMRLAVGALKRSDEIETAKLEREMGIAKQLPDGPFLKVYGSTVCYPVKGEEGNKRMAIIMERAICDLEQASRREEATRKIPLSEMVKCTKDLLRAMQSMHGMNIAHRDLKPENLMMFQTEEGFELKLGDFGFAVKGDGITDKIVGSWEFASPQDLLARVKQRADYLSILIDEQEVGKRHFSDEKFEEINMDYTELDGVLLDIEGEEKGTAFESDIYSLGILIHGMIFDFETAYIFYDSKTKVKNPVSERYKGQNDFLRSDHFEDMKKWHKSFIPDVVIPEFVADYNDYSEDEKEKLIRVGELIKSMCEWDPKKRPTIDKVVTRFNEIYSG